ncbi:MAG: protein phosphatase 2C domain-containing protein [Oscillospiraceae bacterium]|nr:protein phosphatase 2C domain-containing protein [Oscillospiraceae bacterium]
MTSYDHFSLSVRGSGHIKKGVARQDAAATYIDPDGWAVAAVSDGHGGSAYFRSHIGARFAVESAVLAVQEFLRDKELFITLLREEPQSLLRRLNLNILSNWDRLTQQFTAAHPPPGSEDPPGGEFDWSQLVTKQAAEQDPDAPIQDGIDPEWEESWIAERGVKIKTDRPERLYGCTLLAAVTAPEFSVFVQIGDGSSVAVYPGGRAELIFEQDDRQDAGITDSLCERNPIEKFRNAYMLAPDWELLGDTGKITEVATEDEPPSEDEQIIEAETDEALDDSGDFRDDGDFGDGEDIGETEAEAETEDGGEPEDAAEPEPERESAPPAGVILSTDGLFNSFDANEPQQFGSFNSRVLSYMGKEREEFGKWLENHLNERSEKSTDDDISMALIFDADMDFEAVRPK